jgi:hypothetical protein
MKTVHAGLYSSASDWQVCMKHTRATLNAPGVYSKTREECLAAAASFKGEMVEGLSLERLAIIPRPAYRVGLSEFSLR